AHFNSSWDVIATLSPAESSAFRSALGAASGFQSYQFRQIEFLLGNKSAVMIEPHRHRVDLAAPLEKALGSPSIYDEAIRVLARRGFPIDPACVARDWRQSHAFHASAWPEW